MKALPVLAAIALLCAAAPAFADSAQNLSAASNQSAQAVGAFAEAGVKVVSGVVSLPLGVAGAGSMAAGASTQALADSSTTVGQAAIQSSADANRYANAPLTITETTIITPQAAPSVPHDAQSATHP